MASLGSISFVRLGGVRDAVEEVHALVVLGFLVVLSCSCPGGLCGLLCGCHFGWLGISTTNDLGWLITEVVSIEIEILHGLLELGVGICLKFPDRSAGIATASPTIVSTTTVATIATIAAMASLTTIASLAPMASMATVATVTTLATIPSVASLSSSLVLL